MLLLHIYDRWESQKKILKIWKSQGEFNRVNYIVSMVEYAIKFWFKDIQLHAIVLCNFRQEDVDIGNGMILHCATLQHNLFRW